MRRQQTVQGALQTFHSAYIKLYEWKNGVLSFYDSCPRNALCAPAIPETGRLAGDTLTISYGSEFLHERTSAPALADSSPACKDPLAIPVGSSLDTGRRVTASAVWNAA